MIHVIAAAIMGSRHRKKHIDRLENNQADEPLRTDEKIIINIVYWVIILTIAFVLGYIKISSNN